MKKVVQFGAGNIGRGFLGQLFTQSGYEVVFVEVNPKIVSALNTQRSYPLRIVGENPQEIIIKNVRAIDGQDRQAITQEIIGTELIATAVGVSALEPVARVIAQGIKQRADSRINQPINIIICENLLQAGKVSKGYVMEELGSEYANYVNDKVGFVESVVSRMIPVMPEELKEENPLLIMAEEYCKLPVAKKGFVGEVPEINGMVAYDNLEAYEEQKLFVHNLGHSIAAYLGYLKGYKLIWEAIADEEIRSTVEGAMQESGRALNKKWGFPSEEQSIHIRDLLKRFSNRALGDTVQRVGRDPLRKLGPNDRLIGGAKLARECGIAPEKILDGIVAALRYDYAGDPSAVKLAKDLKIRGIDFVLKEICGLDLSSQLAQLIKEKFQTTNFPNFTN